MTGLLAALDFGEAIKDIILDNARPLWTGLVVCAILGVVFSILRGPKILLLVILGIIISGVPIWSPQTFRSMSQELGNAIGTVQAPR